MKALILIDLENEWLDEDSDYYVGDLSELVTNTNKLIEKSRTEDYKIIFIKHVELEGDSFKPNHKNTEIIASINKKETDIVIEKNTIGAFLNTNLSKELKGIDQVVVAGVLTNLCVRKFVEDAYDLDFNIKVIEDCCKAFDKETHEFTVKDLKATREEVKFIKLKDFL